MVDFFNIAVYAIIALVNVTALLVATKRKERVFKVIICLWLILWAVGFLEFANLAAYLYFLYVILHAIVKKFSKKKKEPYL